MANQEVMSLTLVKCFSFLPVCFLGCFPDCSHLSGFHGCRGSSDDYTTGAISSYLHFFSFHFTPSQFHPFTFGLKNDFLGIYIYIYLHMR